MYRAHPALQRETPPPLYSKETNHPSRSDLSPPPSQGFSYQQPSPFQPGTSCLPGGRVGQCFLRVLSSHHHLEGRQQVPHPDNEEAEKTNLELISWFQARESTDCVNLTHQLKTLPCMSAGHIQGAQMCLWVKDL